jgi:6-phosphogluconolactonase (cycloisomerase 2 family)
MSNRVIQLFSAIALFALLGLTACGSFFDQYHSCGTCTIPTFLFSTELNTVSGFTLSASGAPSLIASQAAPNSSEGIIVDKSASFLFISDFQNGAVAAFTINPASGTLSAITGAPFAAGPAPGAGGLAIDPSTKFLYITQMNSAAVAGFTIAAGTGVLTPIPGSPFPTGNTPMQAIVDPSGRFLYVSNLNDAMGGISAYTINPTSGVLTAIAGSPFPTQAGFPGPNHMAIGAGGKFLYVAMSGTANANHGISAFTVDTSSGALTQIAGSPFPTGNDPQGMATDPGGKFLYTANIQDKTVSAFTIDSSSGTLTAVSGSPFTTQAAPAAVAIDPAGQFLFVGESANSGIEAFSINATTGGVSPISGSPFSTSGGVTNLAVGKP